ncbi:MAG: hypothetical protein DYG85_06335 [Chloroflexi bacterium CFX1]|nr:hypothetical protein [Chloroflexi bacterium CFX1]
MTSTPQATVTLTATPTVTFTPPPPPTPDPAQIAAEEMGKLNLVLDTDYTLAPDENGNLAAFNTDGVKIYEPSTHRYNSDLIADIVENMLQKTGDCEKTPFPPGINIMDKDFENWLNDLFYNRFYPQVKDTGLQPREGRHRIHNPFRSVSGNCWGFGLSEPGEAVDMDHAFVFLYPDRKGAVQVFELFNPGE